LINHFFGGGGDLVCSYLFNSNKVRLFLIK
jgi:hypothetical protein